MDETGKVKKELESILAHELDVSYKHLASSSSELFEAISHGIICTETPNFNESVEITSIQQAKSRSVKYLVRFKIGDLFEYISGAIITIAGSVTMPWVIVLGFLILVKQLYDASQVDIDENTSKVLWGMHLVSSEQKKGYSKELNFPNILKRVNAELSKRGYTALSTGEIEDSLKKLEELYIIDKIGDEWEIIEMIQVNKFLDI